MGSDSLRITLPEPPAYSRQRRDATGVGGEGGRHGGRAVAKSLAVNEAESAAGFMFRGGFDPFGKANNSEIGGDADQTFKHPLSVGARAVDVTNQLNVELQIVGGGVAEFR